LNKKALTEILSLEKGIFGEALTLKLYLKDNNLTISFFKNRITKFEQKYLTRLLSWLNL